MGLMGLEERSKEEEQKFYFLKQIETEDGINKTLTKNLANLIFTLRLPFAALVLIS
jgi:hypothetical protein